MEENKKVQKARGYRVQRSYHYDTHKLNDEGKPIPMDSPPTIDEWRASMVELFTTYIEKECVEGGFVFHDRDIDKDGNPAGVHIHAVLKFKNPRAAAAISKKLGISSEANISAVKSYVDSYRYLAHVTEGALNEKKHVYAFDEITMFGAEYVDVIARESEKKEKKVNLAAVKDAIAELHLKIIRNGKTTSEARDELFQMFDDDTTAVLEYTNTARRAFDSGMKEFEYRRALRMKAHGGRDLKTGYIFGPGGVGKTTLARAMARLKMDGRGFHAVAQSTADKTYDLASQYRGEKVSVFDEFSPQAMQMDEFLGVFDRYNYTGVNSRNTDKHWFAEYAYMTTSVHFNDWRRDLMQFSKGGSQYVNLITGNPLQHAKETTKPWQIARRFHFIAELVENEDRSVSAYVFVIDYVRKGFTYAGRADAPPEYWLNRPDDRLIYNGQLTSATDAFALKIDNMIATHEKARVRNTFLVVPDPLVDQKPEDVSPEWKSNFQPVEKYGTKINYQNNKKS